MKRVFVVLSALLFLGNSAFANQETVEAEAGAETGVIETFDTTDNWGITTDSDSYHGKYYYKCKARPYYGGHGGHGGFGSFWGDGYNQWEAKQEALKQCYYNTQKRCYIEFCKKFKKHH